MLYLIRHAEVEERCKGRLTGSTDCGLSSNGFFQAKIIARKLKGKIDLIYSSDRVRALKTAEVIAKHTNTKIVKTALIREISFGEWEGKTWNEIKASKRYANLTVPPKGELYSDFQKRINAFLQKLKKHRRYKKIAIVSHAGAIREVIKSFVNYPESIYLQIDYASVSVLEIKKGKFNILGVNRMYEA